MSFSFFGAAMNSAPDLPLISVVIPNYNGADYLERCLKSLAAQTYRNFEIVLVDNASQDESVRIAQSVAPEAIIILQQRNTGFAGGANAGIKASSGEWVAILNNDTELSPEWLSECAAAIRRRPEAAFFACRILEFAGRERLFSAGDCYLRAGIGYRRGQQQDDRKEFHIECEVFSASGCAALYRKTVLEELDGFDERFFAYLEDVDLGLRLQSAGYTGFYIPRAEVYHHGGATSGGEFSRLSVRLRTRNALLILLKSVPAVVILRCLPMIILAQAVWLLRAAVHGRIGSYLRGVAGAFLLAPAMVSARFASRAYRRLSCRRLWQKILASELQARKAFSGAETDSLFLRWYFMLFPGTLPQKREADSRP